MIFKKFWLSDMLWWLFCLPNEPSSLPLDPFCEKFEYTWDNFYDDAKRKYPTSFFFGYTVPKFLERMWHRLSDVPYWLRTHIYNRYHIINVKQPKGSPDQYSYDWGWIDRSHVLPLAMFNILCDFVENEFMPQYWWRYDEKKRKSYYVKKNERKTWQQVLEEYSEANDPKESDYEFDYEYASVIHSRKYNRELLTIYKWWKVDRLELCKKDDDTSNEWYNFKMNSNRTEDENNKEKELFDLSMGAEEELHKQEEDMLIRLVKIKGGLWT
jgi:hypothetical protein